MKTKHKSHDIFFFILNAFTIPLICIVLMTYTPALKKGILQFILYGIESASPTIATIIMICKRNGILGLKCFLFKKYKKDFSIKLCLIGFMTPAVLLTIAKLLTYLTPYHNQFITIPSFKKFVIILWALIAEELGWRGYLQNKLENELGDKITPCLIGVIWTIWHYHFFFMGTMEVPILFFLYGCILESYGYYIITKLSKGNIVPASLWHFAGNLFFNLYLLDPNWNNGSIIPYTIVNILYICYVGAFIYLKNRGFYQKP